MGNTDIGGFLMKSNMWDTPEEIRYRKERQRTYFYLSLPVAAILIGAVIAFMSQATY